MQQATERLYLESFLTMESSSDRGIWVVGPDKIRSLRINTSDTISMKALTFGLGLDLSQELSARESKDCITR